MREGESERRRKKSVAKIRKREIEIKKSEIGMQKSKENEARSQKKGGREVRKDRESRRAQQAQMGWVERAFLVQCECGGRERIILKEDTEHSSREVENDVKEKCAFWLIFAKRFFKFFVFWLT